MKELVIGSYAKESEAEAVRDMAGNLAQRMGRRLRFETRFEVVGHLIPNGKVTGRRGPSTKTATKLEPCPECGKNDFTGAQGRASHIRTTHPKSRVRGRKAKSHKKK